VRTIITPTPRQHASADPMRLLHVVPSLAPEAGGPARSVAALVKVLRARGLSVGLAGKDAGGDDVVPIEHLAFPGEIPTLASRRALAQAIERCDLVEIHSVWNGTVSVTASMCRSAGVPYVLAPRGMLDPVCLQNRLWLKRVYSGVIEGATIEGAAGYHFLSDEERDQAVIGREVADDEIAVAPNAAPTLPPDLPRGALASMIPASAGRRVVLYLGRLDPIKGVDLQLRAIAALGERERPLLALVGPDYGDEGRLRALARELQIDPWVAWIDPVYGDERFSLLEEADAVLLTSIYDANPVLVTEALAAGGALIATEGCGGVAAAGRAGAAIVVPRTSEAVAAAIRSVATEPRRIAAVRETAAQYAATALAPERTVLPLLAHYERNVARQRGQSPLSGNDQWGLSPLSGNEQPDRARPCRRASA
jgi:glycosyltransferase involved in cell wall biosynthesis